MDKFMEVAIEEAEKGLIVGKSYFTGGG